MSSWPDAALWSSEPVYVGLLGVMLAWSIIAALLLSFYTAPYGRHSREGWTTMNARAAWVVMEAPSPICFVLALASGSPSTVGLGIAALYLVHYTYRSFIYPFRMRADGKTKPLATVAAGVAFNTVNGGLNGYALGHLAPHLTESWLATPWFWLGLVLFVAGFATNQHADHVLRTLRKPGETGYRIPFGGAYRWVSCPNYFGEIVEWTGFALAAGTAPAAAFALFTAANLVPRGVSNHRWYLDTFDDYPSGRRAVIPGLL